MGTRRKSRELALQALYQGELAGQVGLLDFAEFCAHFQANRKAMPYAKKLLDGVLEKREEINRLISRYAENWRLERMSVIDRNILRIALWEIALGEDTPIKVAINEAVELAKVFGSDSTPRFVNGVLGSLAAHQNDIVQAIRRPG